MVTANPPAIASDGASVLPRDVRRRMIRLIVAGVLCVAIGWFASLAVTRSGPVTILGHDQGVVTLVNVSGAKFCFLPDGGGEQRCGVAYERRDTAQLAVGEHVSISVARLTVTADESSDIFVIENRSGAQR